MVYFTFVANKLNGISRMWYKLEKIVKSTLPNCYTQYSQLEDLSVIKFQGLDGSLLKRSVYKSLVKKFVSTRSLYISIFFSVLNQSVIYRCWKLLFSLEIGNTERLFHRLRVSLQKLKERLKMCVSGIDETEASLGTQRSRKTVHGCDKNSLNEFGIVLGTLSSKTELCHLDTIV